MTAAFGRDLRNRNPAAPDTRTPARILVVEDDAVARAALVELLTDEGYHAEGAGGGEEAARRLADDPPDLVISDVSMPEGDGLTLVSQIRQASSNRYIPVILVSAHDELERKIAGLDLGADDYLGKPVDPDELLARVRVHLRQAHRYRALMRRAIVDELTGILNRRGILAELERELERVRRNGHLLSVLVIDLDDFKHINDTHGHAAGDVVLQQVAYALTSAVRLADHVGRIGGDEFLLLAVDSDAAAAEILAERLLGSTPTRMSIGIAQARPDDSVTDLISRADQEMYRHKTGRRGRDAAEPH